MPGQPHQDDSELISRCLAGEAAAWSSLLERYRLLVYAVPTRHGLMPDECDDVFQSVFLSLLRSMPSLRDHRALAKWLIVTATRESFRVRNARPRVSPLAAEPPNTADEPLLAELERLEHHQRIWAAMDRLEPRCRDLLLALFRNPGRPDYGEISRTLGIPVGSIGPSRARCLARLVELIRT